MLQKHLDDMFSKEFDRNPRYLMQIWAVFAGSFASHKLLRTIPEVHSEIGRLRVIVTFAFFITEAFSGVCTIMRLNYE